MWALIPIKALSGAKQRLSSVLSPCQRQSLARAMACDVIKNVFASTRLEGVLVISDDPEIEKIALDAGCEFLWESNVPEPDLSGLNSAVAQGAAWLNASKIRSMMVIHSDLPLLKTARIDSLVETYPEHPTITIVPDRAEQGSNLLICPVGKVTEGFCFQYGVNSLRRHQIEAQRIGIDFSIVSMPDMQFDIDSPQDLHKLMDSRLLQDDSETGRCLEKICQTALIDYPLEGSSTEQVQSRPLFHEFQQPANVHG
ncbi:MAG: 2-phospho-L-lactate guanylyltransferase [Porticoccaceae bacterium]|nr:2-phospho-L-lactate guanylyltransferase [Pseudomonadales bacterium]MCP5171153.1 2-phospho-L-lactate guanylyltransferase [Pseudomonadales bacterium]MCP5301609.1 2-phospho-L-lactate guanylyltransferase [Pseudomonadales bacterium]